MVKFTIFRKISQVFFAYFQTKVTKFLDVIGYDYMPWFDDIKVLWPRDGWLSPLFITNSILLNCVRRFIAF